MADARSVQESLSNTAPSARFLLGGSVLFVIASFLAWQSVTVSTLAGDVTLTANGWHGLGTVAALCAIAVLAIEIARLFGLEIPVDEKLQAVIVAGLAGGILLFTIIKIIDDDLGAYGRWIGLIAALAASAGGVMRINETGGGRRRRPA